MYNELVLSTSLDAAVGQFRDLVEEAEKDAALCETLKKVHLPNQIYYFSF